MISTNVQYVAWYSSLDTYHTNKKTQAYVVQSVKCRGNDTSITKSLEHIGNTVENFENYKAMFYRTGNTSELNPRGKGVKASQWMEESLPS